LEIGKDVGSSLVRASKKRGGESEAYMGRPQQQTVVMLDDVEEKRQEAEEAIDDLVSKGVLGVGKHPELESPVVLVTVLVQWSGEGGCAALHYSQRGARPGK
jgi:hypothetical protein